MPGLSAARLLLLVAPSLAACSAVTLPDTAIMPRTAAGTPVMSDQGAIQTASYVLAGGSRTAGQPGEAARAVAAIDYLAGDLYTSFHWTGLPATTKLRMMQGRQEVRQVLAIAPGAPSQAVVDDLIRAADAFDAHDSTAAEAALSPSVFTLGPQRTAELLSNLPYLPLANAAAQSANYDITFGCGVNDACS